MTCVSCEPKSRTAMVCAMRDKEYLGTANQPKKDFLVNRRCTQILSYRRQRKTEALWKMASRAERDLPPSLKLWWANSLVWPPKPWRRRPGAFLSAPRRSVATLKG